MAMQMICDLCGKPIIGSSKNPRCFTVRELTASLHKRSWQDIDVHDECVRKLLNAVDDRNKPPVGGSSMQEE